MKKKVSKFGIFGLVHFDPTFEELLNLDGVTTKQQKELLKWLEQKKLKILN